MVKRYNLRRVGAGAGAAIFECDKLLGQERVVVDATDYDAAEASIRELEEVLALSEKRRAVIEAEWGYVIAKKDKAEARVIELETALTEAIDWIGASPEGGFDEVVQRLSRIATSQFDRGDKP